MAPACKSVLAVCPTRFAHCWPKRAQASGEGADPGLRSQPSSHYAMLQRNLLYTGTIRGKKLVVLIGQKKAVAIAVRNVSGRRRWSKLSEWLNPQRGLAGV
jgi:hypothetical protein